MDTNLLIASQAGRNWEGFSNDPYLAGVAMSNVRFAPFQWSSEWRGRDADFNRQFQACKQLVYRLVLSIIVRSTSLK